MYKFKPALTYRVNGEKRSSSNVDTADYTLELSVNESKIKQFDFSEVMKGYEMAYDYVLKAKKN